MVEESIMSVVRDKICTFNQKTKIRKGVLETDV